MNDVHNIFEKRYYFTLFCALLFQLTTLRFVAPTTESIRNGIVTANRPSICPSMTLRYRGYIVWNISVAVTWVNQPTRPMSVFSSWWVIEWYVEQCSDTTQNGNFCVWTLKSILITTKTPACSAWTSINRVQQYRLYRLQSRVDVLGYIHSILIESTGGATKTGGLQFKQAMH